MVSGLGKAGRLISPGAGENEFRVADTPFAFLPSAVPASNCLLLWKMFFRSHLITFFLIFLVTFFVAFLIAALVAVAPTRWSPALRVGLDDCFVMNGRSVVEVEPH